jgi:uncharacterized lipoprotein YbaY
MKNPVRLFLAAAMLLLVTACQHIELAQETDPDRVVAGTITLASDMAFPPDAELVVRIVDLTPTERPRMTTGVELPIVDHSQNQKTERVLGEQVIRAPGAKPIPFRVEFRADDDAMRRGLNIDARVSIDGKVRYRTLSAHAVTLASVQFPHEVYIEPVN